MGVCDKYQFVGLLRETNAHIFCPPPGRAELPQPTAGEEIILPQRMGLGISMDGIAESRGDAPAGTSAQIT